jgi:hypothetical protein
MPKHDELKSIAGVVTHVFAHRFVVESAEGATLADLGPKGLAKVALRKGEKVEVLGERKPSEIKVRRIAVAGAAPVDVEHGEPEAGRPPHEAADPTIVEWALREAGLTLVAGPLRRPKHFEVLAKDARGDCVEAHLEFDGGIRMRRPGRADEPKWAAERRPAHLQA